MQKDHIKKADHESTYEEMCQQGCKSAKEIFNRKPYYLTGKKGKAEC